MSARRVAVIGGGLGGITAAGELQRQGHAVTLFEQAPRLGGKARALSVDGFTLDTGPTLLTLPHLVREGFRRLDAEDLLPRFVELALQCDYHWPDGACLKAHRALDETAASAEQLGAGEGEGVRRFYAEAAAIHRAAGEPYLEAALEGAAGYLWRVGRRGLSALWRGARLGTLDALATRHFRTPHLRQFVGRFATYAGASPYEASAAFALIPHVEQAFGVHYVVGGMGALSAALARALERLGVTVRCEAAARWEAVGGGFVAGPPGEQEPFDALIVNADPLAALARSSERLALSGYVLGLGCDRRLTLPHHSIGFAPDARDEFTVLFAGRVPDASTLYFCHPAATDPTAAPEGHSGVFAMVNAPALRDAADVRAWAEHAPRLRERCLARLRALCPELAGSQVRVLFERTPVDLAREGAPGGSIYGFLPHGRLGPFRRPRMRAATKGLFFSGGGTHPGGGVPLVMLSGHFAAELAGRHLRGRA